MRSVVDLPAPLGPSSPVMRPSAAREAHVAHRRDGAEVLAQAARLDHGGGPFSEVKNGIGRASAVQ